MPDFSHLYKRPAGLSAEPKALPQEQYPGIIKFFEFAETSTQKIPVVRVHLALLGWPDSVQEKDRYLTDGEGKQVPIEITKKQFRRDFMTPEDFSNPAWFYFDQFLRTCGLEPQGHSYEELIPQLIGQRVTVEIQQYLNQNTNNIGNQVGRVFGPNPV